MSITIGVFYFLLGTIIGSFLNVVIARHNTGVSLKGRSACSTCAAHLSWFELIPIVSYFALKGRCRTCGSHISIQYPMVELFTGLLFLGIFFMDISLLKEFFLGIVISLLVIIFVYDLHHKIIPNTFVYTFILLAFMQLFIDFQTLTPVLPSLMDLFAGPLLLAPFFLLWFMSSGAWMGLGDAKLALGIGWMLGLSKGITAITFAFWIGAVVGVTLLLLPKVLQRNRLSATYIGYTMKSEVPFAPFLIVGFILALFLNVDIFYFLN